MTTSATDYFDPTAAMIVLASHRGDSIHRISEKIDVSYSWVYDWVDRLEDRNIISKDDTGIHIEDHDLRVQYDQMMASLYRRGSISQADAYRIPHFAGMEFAYTEIDAAYVWTKGGFQIARSHDDYPIFIDVHDRDVERWTGFFARYGLDVTVGDRPDARDVDGDIHYVVFPQTDGIDVEWVEGNPVIPLQQTIDQLVVHREAYEPALEIIADEYEVDIETAHHTTEGPNSP